ncbi:MAG: YbjN domain-containing protein [Magnetococcales bacterium]|nr:YbjN domain-containing protein [Magnetococcales bacterium]
MTRSDKKSPTASDESGENPVGMVEEFAIENDWNSDRVNEHELWAEMPSSWGSYRLWVVFHEESEFLQFNCYLNIKIPPRMQSQLAEAISLINERIWLGHFEIWGEELVPLVRVVLPLRGSRLTQEQLEDVMDALDHEANRFFPAFQWIIWGGKSVEDAVSAALVDTEGEA